jgi:Flp pilus assembly protein TadD
VDANVWRPRPWLWLLLAVATLAAYSPAFKAPFDFDDLPAIVDNATIQQAWPPTALVNTPQRGTAVSGRPIANYSFALNVAVNRMLGVDQRPDPNGPDKTIGYHAVNLVLHLLCGLLLFGIIARALRSFRYAERWSPSSNAIAMIATAIWLLHPIQTEAVDYVVQRTELLVSALYLGTLFAAIRSEDAEESGPRRRWAIVAVLLCLLGMGTKEVMLTAPLMVVLYDRAFRWSSWRETLRGDGVRLYVALGATMLWSIALIAGGARGESVGFRDIPWYQYFYSQAWAITHYLRLTIWPTPLLHDYGMTPIGGLRGVPGLVLLAVAAGITLAAWTRANRWGWLGFLGAWFFLLLAPSSSVVPIRTEIAAERRIYLALAAVFVLAVLGADLLRRRLTSGSVVDRRPWLVGVPVALCIVLGAATFERSRLYAQPVMLWRQVVEHTPENARAYNGLAIALLRQDSTRVAEIEPLLRHAIALDSAQLASWTNLATVLMMQGRIPETRQLLEHALVIEPGNFDAEDRLGRVLAVQGESQRAIPMLERSAAYRPSDVDAHVLLGVAYVGAERWDDAARTLSDALHLDPSRADAMRYLGRALVESERDSLALPYLETATRLAPRSGLGLATLSLAQADLGRADQAIEAARTAVAQAAGDGEVFIVAGRAMLRIHRAPLAEQYFAEAVRLRPNDAQPLTGLAAAQASMGNQAEAVVNIRRALAVDSSYAPARQVLAALQGHSR